MSIDSAVGPPPPWLLVFSAADRAALTAEARSAAALLTDGAEPGSVPQTRPVSAEHDVRRLAVTAADREGLVEGLSFFADGLASPRYSSGCPDGAATGAAWCFGGHGSQWPGMGRALLNWAPAAAKVLTELDSLLPTGVIDPLMNAADGEPGSPATTQPLIFAIQVATAHWLWSMGLRPSAVVGHSLGEVAAAHVAGALSLADAARVVSVRSRLLEQTAGGGTMATVSLDRRTVERRCAEIPGTVVVAAHSAPTETVVTGESEATGALVTALEAEGVRCRRIRINAASHSPFVDGVLPAMRAELADLAPAAPRVPWISTVEDEPDGRPVDATAEYWAHNLRRPVRFTEAVSALARRGIRAYVEIGPHPVLISPIRQTLRAEGVEDPLVIASGSRATPEPVSLLRLLGALHCRGLDLPAPLDRRA
ncbi:acyltransferase domain-containing protein [Streptomyces sp. BE308]|uniref:acyltransferase domain-containing protein n=1 Tax=unclassified Streptomyces TaxID=2593676 RepID=UPI002E792046|nr:acyltransferase domain-containing protein [Streptomyces sp. BE308]MEE1794849.1 acyltransferase domain-containing protein [Streptomyces sp. BE308]